MNKPIPQMEPWFDHTEKEGVAAYLDRGAWLTEFEVTKEFERLIAEYCGVKHAIVVTSGSTALIAVAMALDLKPGDEVLVPNFTMIATPNSILPTGATVVFVDVDRETLCMDLEAASAAVTERTRAIMFVNANGRYPRGGIDGFMALAKKNGLALVEDSAQSLGCRYPDGRHMGTVGIAGILSFSVPKIITTGQGGAIMTNDDAMALKCRKIKDFGRIRGGIDVHDLIGHNFKFTDLQAAVGVAQMKKVPWRVERKKAIYARYRDRLQNVAQLSLFDQDIEHTTPWFIDCVCERRAELIEHLKANGIGTRVMYPPINKQEAYRHPGEHPVSNWVGEKGLWLPSASQLSDHDIDRICELIAQFYH